MLTENLMRLTVAGGSEWVMYLLLALSAFSLYIIGERGLFLHHRAKKLDHWDQKLRPLINAGDNQKIAELAKESTDPVLLAATQVDNDRSNEATEKVVASALGRERLKMQRKLGFLGTLGSNAPFIGLFGTVLGIIRAFHDLSIGDQKGTSAVMSGISEALVATAIGLFVAIPAVMAFNYFQKKVDHTLSISEALAQGILANRMPTAANKKEA